MKKLISCIVTLSMLVILAMPVFAVNESGESIITEQDMIDAINNGTATITTEVRDISSYTPQEIAADAGLTEIFNQLGELSARSINKRENFGKFFTTTVDMPGSKVVFRSTARAFLQVTDVMTGGSSDISTTFNPVGTVSVNGTPVSGWANRIIYKNISVSLGCGDNTAFTSSVKAKGNLPSSPSANIAAIIGWIANVAGYPSVTKITSAFSLISFPDSNYTTSKQISQNYVRAVGLKWKSNTAVYNDNHNLGAECSISTIDSSKPKNVTTYAAVKWTYDVYFDFDSTLAQAKGQTVSTDTSYLVNMVK